LEKNVPTKRLNSLEQSGQDYVSEQMAPWNLRLQGPDILIGNSMLTNTTYVNDEKSNNGAMSLTACSWRNALNSKISLISLSHSGVHEY